MQRADIDHTSICKLQEENDRYQRNLADKDDYILRLRKELDQLRAEGDSLNIDVGQLSTDLRSKEETGSGLRLDKEDLQRILGQEKDQNSVAREDQSQMRSDQSNIHDHHKALSDQLASAEEELKIVNRSVESKHTTLKAREHESHNKHNQLMDQDSEISAARETLAQFSADVDHWDQRLSELQDDNGALSRALDSDKARNSDHRNR